MDELKKKKIEEDKEADEVQRELHAIRAVRNKASKYVSYLT